MFLAGGFGRLLKDNPDKATEYGAATTFFVFMYTAVFGATWLTIPWVYPTEVSICCFLEPRHWVLSLLADLPT